MSTSHRNENREDGAGATPPRPKWGQAPLREFLTTQREEELGRYHALGLQLGDVLASEAECFESACAAAVRLGGTAAEVIRGLGDLAVWDGVKIAAILRPQPDGTLRITRFDRPGSSGGHHG